MTFIKCNRCKKEINNKIKICPHCNYNLSRRNYFQLTYKEKQMINNIIQEKENKLNVFNILYIIIFIPLLIIFVLSKLYILAFALIPIAFILMRFKIYYYYLNHNEIDFDKDKNDYKELSKDTDKQLELFKTGKIAIICIILIMTIIGIFVFNNNNNDDNKNDYNQEWCNSSSNSYQKCYYSHYEDRCICKDR